MAYRGGNRGLRGGGNRGLSERRWFSSSQPQTLQIAVMLLYWNAALGLLFGLIAGGLGHLYLLLIVADGLGGFGVANERKWGYFLALIAALLPFVVIFLTTGSPFSGGLLNLIFEVALVVALLHPMSRSYYKLWFR